MCLRYASCKQYIKIIRFIKKIFFTGLTILSSVNPLSATLLNVFQ